MSGVPSALHQAFAAVRMGGRVQLLGIPDGNVPMDFANEIIFKGITVYGVIGDRKSTRLNSSHITISYAVFCLKKKKKKKKKNKNTKKDKKNEYEEKYAM